MARNTQALVVAVCMMFLNNLYVCGPIDGYKFPVYTTPSCPQNKTEWLERSFFLNCTNQNGYMCLPNEMLTDLVEFCYTKDVVSIPKGICLVLDTSSSAVDAYHCHTFSNGCPSYEYFSSSIYEHQSCVSIVEGCFLADPYCERIKQSVSANRKPTTSRYNTEEGTQTNSITPGTSDFTSWMTIAVFISIMSGVLLTIGIYVITKKGFKRCCEEPSFNRNSNQLLLTDRASDQIVQLLQYISWGSTYGR